MATYTMKDFINKKIAVRVGQNHIKEFLRMCEEARLRWLSGCTALNFIPDMYGSDLAVTCGFNEPKALEFSDSQWYAKQGYTVVDFDDFIAKSTSRYQIIIECDGDITTAKMTINGKETKVAKAKRNPDDKFDWKKGAALAFERIWDKNSEKKDGEFKVGDRVVIINPVCGNKHIVGKHGRIVAYHPSHDKDEIPFGVEMDCKLDVGHNCGYKTKDGHGWWVGEKDMRHESSAHKTKKVKEVKRQAHVGEWVKIVAPECSSGELYEKGDILKVVEITLFGNAKLSCGGEIAGDHEYVVLEGYEPGMEV